MRLLHKHTHKITPQEQFDICKACGFAVEPPGIFKIYDKNRNDTIQWHNLRYVSKDKITRTIHNIIIHQMDEGADCIYRAAANRQSDSNILLIDIDINQYEDRFRTLSRLLCIFNIRKMLYCEIENGSPNDIDRFGRIHCAVVFSMSFDDNLIQNIEMFIRKELRTDRIELISGGSTLAYPNCCNYVPIKSFVFDEKDSICDFNEYTSGDEFYIDVIDYTCNNHFEIIDLMQFLSRYNINFKLKNKQKNNRVHPIIIKNNSDNICNLPFCNEMYKSIQFGRQTRYDFLFRQNAARNYFNEILNRHFGGKIDNAPVKEIFDIWYNAINRHHDGTSRDWDKSAQSTFDQLYKSYDEEKAGYKYIFNVDLLSNDLTMYIPLMADVLYQHLDIHNKYSRAKIRRTKDSQKGI
ncbi:MAG TPA: hypothetical protein PKI31_14825, partial [Spirochaetota bacterium]|nr:hypothetical protein [Spirochaetota bacterium]